MTDPLTSDEQLSPIELVVLQGTSLCNLNCTYCDLSAASRRSNSRMELGLVDRLFSELFHSGRLAPEVHVVWHSGEPLTLPPSYYDEAISHICDLKDKIVGPAVALRFGIQTNGVLITDEWCDFFKRHQKSLDLGVSCDGSAEMHDSYRLSWAGAATHTKTTRGMDLLQANGIRYKIIAVVTNKALAQPDDFYNFFFERRKHLSGFHFNILAQARSNDPGLSYSVNDRALYYAFFRRLLKLSHASEEAGEGFVILNFTQCLARILGAQTSDAPSFIEETSAPLKSLNVDSRGNVTTFYAGLGIETLSDLYGDGKGFSIGNIFDVSFDEMTRSDKLSRMIHDFKVSTRSCKASCEYFPVCSGGFEVTKKQTLGTFDGSETIECAIHVKTLVDAMLDDISEHLDRQPSLQLEVSAGG